MKCIHHLSASDRCCLQAVDTAVGHESCSSRQSQVAAYPVQVKHGLLWLWGEAGSTEFILSSAKALPTASEAENPSWLAS